MIFSMRSIAMMITQLPTEVVHFLYCFLKGHLLTFYSYLPFSLIGNLFCLIFFAISGLFLHAVVRPILDSSKSSNQIPASALSNNDVMKELEIQDTIIQMKKQAKLMAGY
ncbi:hypothetical protein P3L10_032962 [Capsicum annuum]|uniref:uncharacterized protein LOC107851805 n=1 Tax=Capsicum annuum TaxID=4072 RepID=UPI001FB06F44|nr:uncharacterized protein LOC107851805 [Capsicum annuum]